MSGRRLLDLTTFLRASRNVATKHIALQRQQLDVHVRTSSLTRELKSQADNISRAAQAASELTSKFQGSGSSSSTPTPKQQPTESSASTQDNSFGAEKTQPLGSESTFEDLHQRDGVPESNPGTVTQPGSESVGYAARSDGRHISRQEDVTASEQQEEPPQEVVGQLFRSPRVAGKLFPQRDGSSPRNPPVTSERDESPMPRTPSPSDLGGISRVRDIQAGPDLDTISKVPPPQEGPAQALPEENASRPESTQISESGSPPETTLEKEAYQMVESRVPSSRVGRLWEYGGLAASMAFGVIGEGFRRSSGSENNVGGSLLLSSGNVERLVNKLSKMRGAALKLGQMMSFQDSKMLPPTIQEVLQRVQDRANYMPAWQRDKVMSDNLGPNWRELFETFDEIPIAAASIGQVHSAVMKSTGQQVAVKVQYPGVADSIDSDLNNLSILLTASRLLPKGLYLDKTIANARTELAWECDYVREAECGRRFKELLADETSTFIVPDVISEASGKQVLTMERMEGITVTKIASFTQPQRDWIGTQILRLCLREICEFRYMQTDPNWTNFLYNSRTEKLELLDFGASRAYPASFINTYIRVLLAASHDKREECRDLSVKLGYLTGYESQAMIDAHVSSVTTLAEPFMSHAPDVYDFRDQTITDRVRDLIPLMLRERLAPPPEETYSLHRKLSGAFLLCARLGSRVRCRELFEDAVKKVDWEAKDQEDESLEHEDGNGGDAKVSA